MSTHLSLRTRNQHLFSGVHCQCYARKASYDPRSSLDLIFPNPPFFFTRMPNVCPVCSKNIYSTQNCIQCDTCHGWVHHENRLRCSGLTDTEFEEHKNDPLKPFECDHCVSVKMSKE